MNTTSLYTRIGGATVVAALVDEFYERVLDDPFLAPCFDGIDMARLRGHQRTFVAAAIGGPEQYRGAQLGEAHARLEITNSMFDLTIGHLRATLAGLGLDAESVSQISLRISSLRDDIVTMADPPEAPSPPAAERPYDAARTT